MGGGYFGAIYFGQYSTGAPLEDIAARRVVGVDASSKRGATEVQQSRGFTDATSKRTATET